MNLVPNKASRFVARTVLKTQKHSPTLLWGAGIVGFGATVVLAAAATLKVESVLDRTQKDLLEADFQLREGAGREHAKALIYVNTGIELGKLYGPSIVCGAVSITCLTQSHLILKRRHAALSIAYAGLEKAYRDYRERVRDQYGADAEQEIFYGTEHVNIVTEGKNGKDKKTPVRVAGRSLSPYAVLYDESNSNWQVSPEFRFLWLKGKQNWMNKQLERKGHVFLNDVFDELDIPRTSAGSQVGWLLEGRDGFVDFGFEDPERADVFLDFVLGREGSVWLDFNVDGEIWREI